MILLALPVAWAVGDRRVTTAVRNLGSRLGFGVTRSQQDDDVLLAELTALGLSAGLSFSASLEAAAHHVSESGRDQVLRALRMPEGRGETGPASGLFALADRALVTGAPLMASVDGYALSLRRDRRAAAIQRVRRLPVKLLFPLALLILPGFLLLTIGPALLAGLERLRF
ncbi:MAG: hypothetical protein BMS9Abin07_2202 [Acidimicrobiia bacterium]|nr:MAG: hypothetical protein BMS9Abin07_2202 [Acidimicrobiia bacterium]